ncbi:MAG: energy transducer TonB [Thermonemataceae bacterium]
MKSFHTNAFTLVILLLLAFTSLQAQTKPPIFSHAEKVAEFPGGAQALETYLAENINYLERAKTYNIQGMVFLSFIVNKDGSVEQVKVVRGIGGGCDEEAIRVLENSPKWIPAEHEGKTVRMRMTQPVYFKLPK